MSETILYFSYGSNMSTARLVARAPSARVVCVGMLYGHSMGFHKTSRDGSAKCNVLRTRNHDDVVYGVVYALNAAEKEELDRIEGLGRGYREKTVEVISLSGELLEAVTYYTTSIDDTLAPFEWYKEHVLKGAREHNLPAAYVEAIEAVDTVPDPVNQTEEMSIYRQQD